MGEKGLDSSQPFANSSFPSLRIVYEGGSGTYGISNRGLGNHGYALQAGKPYDGYLYAKGTPGVTVPIAVRLADTVTGELLGEIVIPFTPTVNSSWTRLNFTLTPSASTSCVGIANGSVPNIDCGSQPYPTDAYLCVSCNGEFQIGLQSAGVVYIGYVFLEPGQWGRLPGLPVLSGPNSAVQWLRDMGISMIR